MFESNLERKRFRSLPLPNHSSSLKEVRTETQTRQDQEPTDSKARERDTYWLAPHGLLTSFVTTLGTSRPRIVSCTVS